MLHLQAPFNQYSFQLVGETSALQYFSIAATGEITPKQSLVGGPSQFIVSIQIFSLLSFVTIDYLLS